MALNLRLPKLVNQLALLLFVGLIFIIAPSTSAQFTDLRVTVGDTTALPNEQNTVISIYMDNFVDDVAVWYSPFVLFVDNNAVRFLRATLVGFRSLGA